MSRALQLATGNNRIVLSVLTTLLCYLIYIADFSFLPVSVLRPLYVGGNQLFCLPDPLLVIDDLGNIDDRYYEIEVNV